MRKMLTVGVALLVLLLAAPAWSQAADPAQPPFVGELVALALRYAQETGGPLGSEAQEQIRNQVRHLAAQMSALGYGEPQIRRAALQGLRETLVQLQAQTRTRTNWDQGLGETLRITLQQQLHLAECDGAEAQVRTRRQERLRTGSAGPVANPPGGGPGGPGNGGKS